MRRPEDMAAADRAELDQLGLTFTPAEARRAAHAAIRRPAPRLRSRVFAAIAAAGARGLTTEEIERATGLRGNTVRPRLAELREEGRVQLAPRTRPTESGRAASVWVVSPGAMP